MLKQSEGFLSQKKTLMCTMIFDDAKEKQTRCGYSRKFQGCLYQHAEYLPCQSERQLTGKPSEILKNSCFAFVRREFKFWAYAYMPTCRQRIRRTAGRTGEIWVGPGMYAHFQVHARRPLGGTFDPKSI